MTPDAVYCINGKFHFEKHKLFLFKEDFDRFAESLQEVVNYIRKNQPKKDTAPEVETTEEVEVVAETVEKFSDIEFEDI